MALIVEDGTGLANSNSYIDISAATAYHADRNNTAWAAADVPSQTAALINASTFIDSKYRSSFKGYRKNLTQAMEWPRVAVLDDWGFHFAPVANEVKNATAEAALRALNGPLMPDLVRGGMIEEEQVGPLRTKYAPGAPGLPDYPWITRLLTRVCNPMGGVRISR